MFDPKHVKSTLEEHNRLSALFLQNEQSYLKEKDRIVTEFINSQPPKDREFLRKYYEETKKLFK